MAKMAQGQKEGADTVAPATGAHLFHVTKGEHQAGGVGGIVRDAAVWGGRAVIEGTRIPVFVIADQFNELGSIEAVLECYPQLKRADVHIALAYADVNRSRMRLSSRRLLPMIESS